jgi:hypothetical protein
MILQEKQAHSSCAVGEDAVVKTASIKWLLRSRRIPQHFDLVMRLLNVWLLFFENSGNGRGQA